MKKWSRRHQQMTDADSLHQCGCRCWQSIPTLKMTSGRHWHCMACHFQVMLNRIILLDARVKALYVIRPTAWTSLISLSDMYWLMINYFPSTFSITWTLIAWLWKTAIYGQSPKYWTYANIVDTDEMQQYAASHKGLHCLYREIRKNISSFRSLVFREIT